MYSEMVENFSQYAQTSFYSYKNQYPELEVLKYNIISYSPSKVTIAGLEDNDYYNILISLTFNEENMRTSCSSETIMGETWNFQLGSRHWRHVSKN